MTDTKRDDAIKRELIADAANPLAWERVGVVGPSTSRRPAWYGKPRNIGLPRQTDDARVGGSDAYDLTRALKSASRSAQVISFEDARVKRAAASRPPGEYSPHEAEAWRMKQLHDAIAVLPEGQRHAVELWLDGFQYTDIAQVLRVSVDAVKSRLRDAKRQLRANIDDGVSDQANRGHRPARGAKTR
jgi:DNA-binding CsgD family transcriptional regulator